MLHINQMEGKEMMRKMIVLGITLILSFLLWSVSEATERAEDEKKIKERFVVSNLTVLDKETKLMWTRDANIAWKELNWLDALKFIENLNKRRYAGHSDWRLPSIAELKTLSSKFFSEMGFYNMRASGYWSSSNDANYTGSAWGVFMGYGSVDDVDRIDYYYVLPVRTGQ